MALERALLLFPLLLLLVMGLVSSETAAERFERQHVDSDSKGFNDTAYCNQMMRSRGMTRESCKQFNTFILESIWKIREICWDTKAPCKYGYSNCHRSSEPLQVIECQLTGKSQYPQCKYRRLTIKKHVIVACHGWPSMPVHLDSSKNERTLK